MGRGDKKTAKGKRFLGSFGKSRPHKVASKATKASTEKTTAPKTKATGSKSTAKTEKAAKTKA